MQSYLDSLDEELSNQPGFKKPPTKIVRKCRTTSQTDPDSGYINHGSKRGIGYLMEATVDCKHGILTGVDVYSANEKESVLILRHLERQINLGIPMSRLALDRGYETGAVHRGLELLGIIGYGAQKNMAPAGLTVAIVDRSLAGHELPITPVMYSYQRMIDKDSMYNTPPCWCIYILGLVLAWLERQGGVAGMQELKHARAAKVYDFLDNSALFHACAQPGSRSDMNVTFRTGDDALDKEFISGAAARGLLNLKGHRIAGGMRASLYNAMPMAGVDALVDYLKQFEVEHQVKNQDQEPYIPLRPAEARGARLRRRGEYTRSRRPDPALGRPAQLCL